eukprot:4775-Heterococcus_DN1.PRE.5
MLAVIALQASSGEPKCTNNHNAQTQQQRSKQQPAMRFFSTDGVAIAASTFNNYNYIAIIAACSANVQ